MSFDITQMLRSRVLEEKTKLNISAKTMADTSSLQLSEETIRRFLTGKIADPGVNTVSDICGTVGMKPYEAFMDSTLAAEFKAFLELKLMNAESEADRIRLMGENENLKATITGLVDRIRVLEMQIDHMTDTVKIYERFVDIVQKMLNG